MTSSCNLYAACRLTDSVRFRAISDLVKYCTTVSRYKTGGNILIVYTVINYDACITNNINQEIVKFSTANQIDRLVHDCSISSALTVKILQSCTEPSKCNIYNCGNITYTKKEDIQQQLIYVRLKSPIRMPDKKKLIRIQHCSVKAKK